MIYKVTCEWALGERPGVDLNYRFGETVKADSAYDAERVVMRKIANAAEDESWLERELESATCRADAVEHTAVPWDTGSYSGGQTAVYDDTGYDICICYERDEGMGGANAEFIARACNSHDDLLAALYEIRDRCTTLAANENLQLADIGKALVRITEPAIAKAEAQDG